MTGQYFYGESGPELGKRHHNVMRNRGVIFLFIFITGAGSFLLGSPTGQEIPAYQNLFTTFDFFTRMDTDRNVFSEGQSDQDIFQFPPWDLVMSLAWSPDGKMLAVSAGTQVYFYSIPENFILYQTDIGSFTPALDFSPDGKRCAAGSRDGIIRIWEFEASGGLKPRIILAREIPAHSKGVNTIMFSSGGEWLASGGNDAIARLWDVKTGSLLNEMIGGTFAIPSVAINTAEDLSADSMEFGLAVANGDVLRLRDAFSGRFIGTFWSDQPLFRLAFNPDGSLLATGDISNGVKLWNVSQAYRSGSESYPEPVHEMHQSGIPGKPSGLVWAVVFNPSGDFLASAGGDGQIYLWDVHKGGLVKTFEGHQAAVTSLAFSPDGKWLVSGSLDATVRFWKSGN